MLLVLHLNQSNQKFKRMTPFELTNQAVEEVEQNNQSHANSIYEFAENWVKKQMKPFTADDLKKVIRLLNEAKKLDNDWDQFAVHFDHVHANYLSNLKDRYPNLSPSDLKLCAYLKLNLSSKEIAQLLNITPRAVEVSRYRLRKKLGLKPEVNLFDFLFK